MATTTTGADIKGYPGLVHLMGHRRGMPQFKRFTELNARNLQIIQAELLQLEMQLDAFNTLNQALPDAECKRYNDDVATLMSSNTAIDIRAKLKEYNSALLDQIKLNKAAAPRLYDLRLLQKWIYSPNDGAGFLSAVEAKPYQNDNVEDLVVLTQMADYDIFTAFITENVIPWIFEKTYHRLKVTFGLRLFGLDESDHPGMAGLSTGGLRRKYKHERDQHLSCNKSRDT
ncbi:hypothetical protein GP486_002345 [Trichoglossum hirsutum]|uniref:DUF6594 domain-containing protein n=1 Tax=Trichoglossum hirsutum TaxID=265104 RepID=A0A9P8LF41_9PEZI|nr:hypothetical protein GP486_002345 [Trichoglossum hirsutum]